MDVAVVIVPSSAPGVRVEEDKRRPNEKIIFLWTRKEGSVGDGSLAMDDNIHDVSRPISTQPWTTQQSSAVSTNVEPDIPPAAMIPKPNTQ